LESFVKLIKSAFILKKDKLVVIASLLLFAMTIPSFVILGLDISKFLVSVDYCNEINNFVEKGSPLTSKGIGYVLPCADKETKVLINVAKYELSLSFDNIIEDANNTVINNYSVPSGLGVWKRNNENFEKLKYEYKGNETLVSSLDIIISTNNILRNLNALSECQVSTNIINYGEEKVCQDNLGYMFYNFSYLLVGIICLIILSVEINKLSVILNLRDKKGNMELLRESGI
jgi:hypothetical protein